jgi:hypothetical protein
MEISFESLSFSRWNWKSIVPITNSINKHLLPVYGKPMIFSSDISANEGWYKGHNDNY